ncbi:MAG: hydrogenase maturation factor [Eubacterium sp.]|nr:hydrogenase maturation factor [Eubacterium sp.]
MKIGKVQESVLKRSILNQIHTRREEILLGASVGEDCAAVAVAEDEMLVMSTDPITGTVKDIGSLAIQITVNDLASAGAEPLGVMLTVLLPENFSEQKLRYLMAQAEAACAAVHVQIMGGHTEVTKAVCQPLVSVAGIGKAKKGRLVSTAGARPGMDIIITKWAGIEGTAIIAKEKEAELLEHFPQRFIDQAKRFDQMLSVLAEAQIAVRYHVSAMHDVTEGGIFGALWEMAEASGVGLEIDLKKIPLRQETIEVCEYFGINPYELISSGSMLMAAADGNTIVRELEKQGIHAVVVGKATQGNDRILYTAQERRFLEPPKSDALYQVV